MADLSLEKLREHIAMPDWEKRLLPLLLFKGTRPYHTRALWNVAFAMYLAECPDVFRGRHVVTPDEDHGKLCGILRAPTIGGMRGIFQRMRGSKALTDSFGKAFTEYVQWINPAPCIYERVPLQSNDARHSWWREFKPADAKKRVFKLPDIKSADRSYPYLISKTPEQQLVASVYKVIPPSIPLEIRGDLCQDLIVAILSGETTVGEIPNVLQRYAAKARKIMPDRWRNVSIDADIPGTDGLRIIDTLIAPDEYAEDAYS